MVSVSGCSFPPNEILMPVKANINGLPVITSVRRHMINGIPKASKTGSSTSKEGLGSWDLKSSIDH